MNDCQKRKAGEKLKNMSNQDLRIFEIDSTDSEFTRNNLRKINSVVGYYQSGFVHFEHGTVLIYHDSVSNGTGC